MVFIFIFIFIPPAPFAHPRPSKTKSAISLSQKIKSILRLANSYPPYPTLQTTTPQTVHIHRYTLSQLRETERPHLETIRIFNQPTLTSNFPLGLFFFLFHLIHHVCCRSRTRPLVCLLSSPPNPERKTFWKEPPLPPPPENWDLGRRLTFVM